MRRERDTRGVRCVYKKGSLTILADDEGMGMGRGWLLRN